MTACSLDGWAEYIAVLLTAGVTFMSNYIVFPDQDINIKQERISAERFPDNALELCDNCHWCCTCVDIKGLIGQCPLCDVQVSQIPMTLDEVCVIEFVGKHGTTLRFSKKQQLK